MADFSDSPPPAKMPCWSQGSSAGGDTSHTGLEECWACGSFVVAAPKMTKVDTVLEELRFVNIA